MPFAVKRYFRTVSILFGFLTIFFIVGLGEMSLRFFHVGDASSSLKYQEGYSQLDEFGISRARTGVYDSSEVSKKGRCKCLAGTTGERLKSKEESKESFCVEVFSVG